MNFKEYPDTKRQISVRAYDSNGNLSTQRTRLDLFNVNIIEVKSSNTAPFIKNKKLLFPLLVSTPERK